VHLNQLIYYARVVETGAISIAAQKLHISQPALSKSIKELETELGQMLLIRTNRGIEPTKMGERVYQDIQNIMNTINGWYAGNEQEQLEEQIYVSCIHSASNVLLNRVIMPFSKQYPKIDLVLQNQYVTEIFNTIKNSPVNIAVASLPQLQEASFIMQADQLGLRIDSLFVGTRCLLLGSQHPMAQKSALSLDDLRQLSLATYSSTHDRPSDIYAPYFRNVYKLASKENIMELVSKNEAVWLPVWELVQDDFYVKHQMVKAYPIPITEIAHKISMIVVSSPTLSVGEQLFLAHLVRSLQNFSCIDNLPVL